MESNTKQIKPPPSAPAAVPASWGLENLDQHVLIALAVTFLIVIITSLYFLVIGRRKGSSVVFIGASETGKTSIFTKLLNKGTQGTVISTVANVGEFKPRNGKQTLLLKDLPGHDRVRNKWWETHKAQVRGIVCVIDSSGGSKAIREGAEVLYHILTDSVVTSLKPRVLILANKHDLLPTGRETTVRTQLEKELTTLRLTKSASLKTTGGATNQKQLGMANEDFDFDHISPIKVDFGKSCAKPGMTNFDELLDWLDIVAR